MSTFLQKCARTPNSYTTNTEHPKLHYTSKLYALYTIQHITILQYQFKLGVGGDSSCSIMGKN